MNNPGHSINKGLKTKEDMQAFVLLVFILFIVFTKCYMVFTGNGPALGTALPLPHNKALSSTVYLAR